VEGSYEGASLKAGLSSSNKNTNTTSKGDSKIK